MNLKYIRKFNNLKPTINEKSNINNIIPFASTRQ